MPDLNDVQSGADWQFSLRWEIPQAKISDLRDLLLHITRIEGGYSPQKIHTTLLSFARDGYVPSHDMISRFINSEHGYRAKRRDSYILLVYFLGMLRKEKRSLFAKISNSLVLEHFADYCEQYFEEHSTDLKFRDRYILRQSTNRAARSSGAASELLTVINTLALPENSIFGTDRLVFASKGNLQSSEEIEQRYLTYRYGVEPHFIFKSFTTLSKKRAPNSPVVYRNISKDRFSNPRSIAGFGLNLGTKLYLIGNIDEGSALEIVAFSHFNANRVLLAGLAMSVSASAELIAARVIFRKVSDFPNESEIGRRPYEALKAEVDGFADMMANRIDFDLTKPILYDGLPISQNAMVEAVSKLLRSERGEPRFTYENGGEFNPASSAQYTFNAALREFR